MTPLRGVRISWLMVARNSLLALLAASAASVARREFLVGGGQLDGSFLHALFEVVAGGKQFLLGAFAGGDVARIAWT